MGVCAFGGGIASLSCLKIVYRTFIEFAIKKWCHFMQDINALIELLQLERHPEGGFYREMYRANALIRESNGNSKNAYSSIYYLLSGNDFSAWHRIQSDETWFFHLGCDIAIHYFDAQNALATTQIGLESMQFQATIPAGTWFAAKPMLADAFCLVSCVVGPAFTFTEFEMGRRQMLLDSYGTSEKHIEAILALTRA
jgi:predicted cupin superfamily sugar epimerase